jgi:transposase
LSKDGRFERVFAAVPIGLSRQEIVLHGHLQWCRRCGRRLREPIAFASGKQRFIRGLVRYIVTMCQRATIQDVAEHIGMDWGSVKDVFKNHLRRELRKRSLGKVRLIAIDEFAVRKKQHYLTVVMDLETGQVLWSAEGRSADAVLPFLRRLRRCRSPLQAVAIDMWAPYSLAVMTVFPEVAIVHDPFHIVQMINRTLDNAQRELAARLPRSIRCRRGLRFVLLGAREHLDQNGEAILYQLMTINEPLYKAYLLKEQLRLLWSFDSQTTARRFFHLWLNQAMETGLRSFRNLAKSLSAHTETILSWYRYPISTGPLEGFNNKAKVLKRQAYGFRDLEYFQLRLAFLHASTSRFPG